MQHEHKDTVEARIESGRYASQYLIYNRKSEDEPDSQKNSIAYQSAENQRFAAREALPIAKVTIAGFCKNGIISEKHSGFQEDDAFSFTKSGLVQLSIDRPKFLHLLRLLNQGRFKGIICLVWDRVSRNEADDTLIGKLMRRGVDIRFVSATYDKTSAGELHKNVDGMFARHHSRTTSEKVTLAIRHSREKGLCTYRAPVGYLNEGSMDWKPHDPERAPIILRCFELAKTGEWSLSDLARWAIAEGFTMPPQRRRRTREEILADDDDQERNDSKLCRLPTANSIHKMLTNPFYAGRVRGNDGAWVKSASHEALVSDELFDVVQMQLRKRNTSKHYTAVLNLPLRGKVRCRMCRHVYTPYTQKGITYYGARCRTACPNPLKHYNFDFIAGAVGKHLGALSLTEDELAELDARTDSEAAQYKRAHAARRASNERKRKKLCEDRTYLDEHRLEILKSGVYTLESYAAEERKIDYELQALDARDAQDDASLADVMRDTVELSELLKSLTVLYEKATPHEKEEIIAEVFSELTFDGQTLQCSYQPDLHVLESRFVALGAPKAWLSELVPLRQQTLKAIKRLRKMLP